MFHDEKGREPREDGTNISKKIGLKQANWRDKDRKNAYKRGEGSQREGVEKYQEKKLYDVFLFFVIPSTSGKELYNLACNIFAILL